MITALIWAVCNTCVKNSIEYSNLSIKIKQKCAVITHIILHEWIYIDYNMTIYTSVTQTVLNYWIIFFYSFHTVIFLFNNHILLYIVNLCIWWVWYYRGYMPYIQSTKSAAPEHKTISSHYLLINKMYHICHIQHR